MSTATELVNQALRKVGGKRIMDLTDPVGSAGIAADVLTAERDDLLRSGNWNFATTRANLAPLAAAPVYEFQSAFALPADFLRLVAVTDAGGASMPYKLESVQQPDTGAYVTAILANTTQIFIRYVRVVTDVNAMSPSFRQTLVLRLAKVFAISVAKSNSLYQQIDGELQLAERRARSTDAIEDFPDRLPEGSWSASRGAFGWAQRRDF